MRIPTLALPLLLTPTLLAAQGTVWTVDDDGGGDFTEIQAAVDAAASGDTILVEDGSYTGFAVDAKQLVVVGVAGASVKLAALPSGPGMVTVRNLAAAQSVVVRGIDVEIFTFLGVDGFSLSDNQGPVWIEDCQMLNPVKGFGASVTDCDSVVLARCTFAAGSSFQGLFAIDSSIYSFGSTATGGSLPPPLFPFPQKSPAGVQIVGGALFVSGSTFTGGVGSSSVEIGGLCITPGIGGDGLVVQGSAGAPAVATTLATTLAGGAGGSGGICGGSGEDGGPLSVGPGGIHTALTGPERTLVVSSPVGSTDALVATLEAPAGELAFVAYAAQPDAGAPMPALLGVQLVTPLAVVSLGPVPAGGQLVFTAAAAPGPGQSAATFFSQAAFFGSGLALASPSVTTLVAMPL